MIYLKMVVLSLFFLSSLAVADTAKIDLSKIHLPGEVAACLDKTIRDRFAEKHQIDIAEPLLFLPFVAKNEFDYSGGYHYKPMGFYTSLLIREDAARDVIKDTRIEMIIRRDSARGGWKAGHYYENYGDIEALSPFRLIGGGKRAVYDAVGNFKYSVDEPIFLSFNFSPSIEGFYIFKIVSYNIGSNTIAEIFTILSSECFGSKGIGEWPLEMVYDQHLDHQQQIKELKTE